MRSKTELRPYQNRIATHLYEHDETIAVARMGGGKTAAALTAIEELLLDGVIRHALVIAPKRVANVVWPDEIADWEHTQGLKYTLLTGTPKQREQKLCLATMGQITMIGFDLVSWLLEQLERCRDDHPLFDLLVIDEISKLRDPTGVRSKLIANNASRWNMVWGLTGTLRPNSALDLFMPARIVTRAKLWGRSYYKWRAERFYPLDYNGYTWGPLPGAEDRINAEIAPHIVTLEENDMPQLPELSVIIDYVDLPEKARRSYSEMHKKLFAKVDGRNVLAANAAVATGKLGQAANGFMYDEGGIVALHDEKRQWLQDIVEQASGPTLLIYEFIEDLHMMQELLGYLPTISGTTDAEARAHINAWNSGRLKFMALHPASGGHGLNLQAGGADMVWISPTWSPELWEQTIARLHRPGQGAPVMVRVCVARNTVDEMKLDRVHRKMSAQTAFEKYLAAIASAQP